MSEFKLRLAVESSDVETVKQCLTEVVKVDGQLISEFIPRREFIKGENNE